MVAASARDRAVLSTGSSGAWGSSSTYPRSATTKPAAPSSVITSSSDRQAPEAAVVPRVIVGTVESVTVTGVAAAVADHESSTATTW